MNVSIIICTRDRSQHLRQTLLALETCEVPPGMETEIVVVDNGSSDDTPQIVREHPAKKIKTRYVSEPITGQSRARNTGIAAAAGEVIIFTDDDVRPSAKWLEYMAGPLLRRECDGAVGKIELPPELQRPWMTQTYSGGIAKYEGPSGGRPLVFIGANMGMHRSVFERVPAFDPEVGPGTLGLFDDMLFSWQLAEAGFKLRYIPEASVVHHAESSRLLRGSCVAQFKRFGESLAYVGYHWKHEDVPIPWLRSYYYAFKLNVRRILQPPPPVESEGIPPWEVSYITELWKARQFLIERRRPRNYTRRGLIKKGP